MTEGGARDWTAAEAAHLHVRDRSKQLLGGMYRAEVASVIGNLGDKWWTRAELAEGLTDVPASCIHKELMTLLEWDLVVRHSKNEAGEYRYSRAGFPEYWETVRLLAKPARPPQNHPAVVRFPKQT
jgi:hypothetical protein